MSLHPLTRKLLQALAGDGNLRVLRWSGSEGQRCTATSALEGWREAGAPDSEKTYKEKQGTRLHLSLQAADDKRAASEALHEEIQRLDKRVAAIMRGRPVGHTLTATGTALGFPSIEWVRVTVSDEGANWLDSNTPAEARLAFL